MSKSSTTGGFNRNQPSVTLLSGVVDWKQANVFSHSISANQTYSFMNETDGKTIVLKIANTTASTLTLTFPASVLGSDTSITANKEKIITLIKIGSNIYSSSIDSSIPVSSFSATGGTITTSGLYTIHTFTGNGIFTVSSGSKNVEYLVAAGGGGGGSTGGPGGGAGGLIISSSLITPLAYTVSVGSGGIGAQSSGLYGQNGGNSIFGSIATSIGGGGGAGGGAGSAGGSGGGGSLTAAGGAGTAGQGNAGGGGNGGAGGGAGGAGGAGTFGITGAGITSAITGTNVVYCTGGATASNAQTPATPNSGNGGNGYSESFGLNGQSGIVIIRYLT